MAWAGQGVHRCAKARRPQAGGKPGLRELRVTGAKGLTENGESGRKGPVGEAQSPTPRRSLALLPQGCLGEVTFWQGWKGPQAGDWPGGSCRDVEGS